MKIIFVGDPHYTSVNVSSRKDFYPDTILGKTKQVLDMCNKLEVDLLVFGGDFCHTKRLGKTYENRLLDLFRAYDVQKACVIGNHDEYHGLPSTIMRTPLGSFFLSGVFLPEPGEWTIETDDVLMVFFPYVANVSEMTLPDFPDGKIKILFSHYYLSNSWGSPDNIPHEFVDKFDYAFLGHDHDIYDIKKLERVTIIRPGSLGRGTKGQSNWVRDVAVAYLDTDEGNPRYIRIEAQPADKIFSKERLELDQAVKNTKLVEQLAGKGAVAVKRDPDEILKSMDITDELRDRTRHWFTEFGILN